MPDQRFAALDSDFLIRLYAGDEGAQQVFDWLGSNGLFPVVTQSVVQELTDVSLNDPDPENCEAAKQTLACLSVWGCLTPVLTDINGDIARITAGKILDSGALGPSGLEFEGLVIAEAALEDCTLLISNSENIVTAAADHLKLVLVEAHVADVLVVTHTDILTYLNSKP